MVGVYLDEVLFGASSLDTGVEDFGEPGAYSSLLPTLLVNRFTKY